MRLLLLEISCILTIAILFRLIMFLAKHQRTSVDRFISDLYFEHTDLAILENYVPKKLKDIDFFLATTVREYLTLSYEARKEVLPILIRECYRV